MKSIHDSARKDWMVIYTRSRWEKKVDDLLKQQEIKSFCPLVKTSKQWADRKKTVEIPLFSSYLFVQVNLHEQLKVRQTAGVINFINYEGRPAVLRDTEIERIGHVVRNYNDVESISLKKVNVGDKINIKAGAFTNHNAEVIQVNGKSVLVVIDQLDCALIAKVKISL